MANSPVIRRFAPRSWGLAIALFLCIHVTICLVQIHRTFPNVDEIAHLPAAHAHWKFQRFDMYRVNPPLARVVCTIFSPSVPYEWSLYTQAVGERPEFDIGITRLKAAGLQIAQDFLVPRHIAISFSLFGAICGAIWIFQATHCRGACLVFLGYWIFSPDTLSMATSICPDLAAVSLGMFACYLTWRAPFLTSINAVWIGFGLGLAMLTKLTWLTGLVSLPISVALASWLSHRGFTLLELKKLSLFCLVLWSVSLFVLNAGYLFEGTFTPLAKYEFCSEMLGGEGSNTHIHGNRFRTSALGSIPVPLPSNYLLGIDYLKYEVETKKWSFLMGEWKFGGWPHYYVMTIFFKTPEPTIVAAVLGFCVLIIGIRKKIVDSGTIRLFLCLGLPALVCLMSVSLQGGFNHHHRYILMVYPVIFALAAYVASPVSRQLMRLPLPMLGKKKRNLATPVSIILLTLSIVSTLSSHPFYTSYFNTLSGGAQNGWRLLGYSNVDWGQDLLDVDKWIKGHPECRPVALSLDYFDVNGELFGLPTLRPIEVPKTTPINDVRDYVNAPQWWIVSVNRLHDHPGGTGLEYLQQIQPVAKIANAYHVYLIEPRSVPSH